MPICKYCGNEAGETEFCRSCGAKLDVEAVTPQRMTADDYRQLEQQQTISNDSDPKTGTDPVSKFFHPQTASGLLTGNIIVLVLGILMFCNSLGVTGLAIIFSILGIISASKVKTARSDMEVNSLKNGATFMMVLGIITLVVGFAVLVVLKILGTLAHGLTSLIF